MLFKYSLTAVKQMGMFYTIAKIFSQNGGQSEAEGHVASFGGNMSMLDLYTRTAHTKHNLIIRYAVLWAVHYISKIDF